MELINKYLQAVKPGLPRAERDDILSELSDDIRTQIEERTEELGRPLTEEEEGEILRHFGHPLLVAGRYRHDTRSVTFGRQLIGPELFPFYIRSVSWAVGIAMGAVLTVYIVLSIVHRKFEGGLMGALAFQFLLQFGIQTVGWIAIQSHYTKNPDSWNQERSPAAKSLPDGSALPSRFESISQIVVTLAIAPWYLNILMSPNPSVGPVNLEPIWHRMFPAIVVLLIASLVQAGVTLVHPDWVRFRRTAQIVTGSVGLAVLGMILAAGHWFTINEPTLVAHPTKLAQVDHLLNSVVTLWILLVAGGWMVGQLVWSAWKLSVLSRRPSG